MSVGYTEDLDNFLILTCMCMNDYIVYKIPSERTVLYKQT